jgi:hypothetical protein
MPAADAAGDCRRALMEGKKGDVESVRGEMYDRP